MDSKDNDGHSSLSHTAGSGHEVVVKLLQVLHIGFSTGIPRVSF